MSLYNLFGVRTSFTHFEEKAHEDDSMNEYRTHGASEFKRKKKAGKQAKKSRRANR